MTVQIMAARKARASTVNDVYLVHATWRQTQKVVFRDGKDGDVQFTDQYVGAIVVAKNEREAIKQTRPTAPEWDDGVKVVRHTCRLIKNQSKAECIGSPISPLGIAELIEPGVILLFDPRGPKMRELRKKFRQQHPDLVSKEIKNSD